MGNENTGTSLPDEIKSGADAIADKAALKAAGMDESSPGADAFLDGLHTAQRAKSDETGAGDTRDAVHKEFSELSPEEREAYKAGYRTGQ